MPNNEDLVPCPSCEGSLPCCVQSNCGGGRWVTREVWARVMGRPYVDKAPPPVDDSGDDAREEDLYGRGVTDYGH